MSIPVFTSVSSAPPRELTRPKEYRTEHADFPRRRHRSRAADGHQRTRREVEAIPLARTAVNIRGDRRERESAQHVLGGGQHLLVGRQPQTERLRRIAQLNARRLQVQVGPLSWLQFEMKVTSAQLLAETLGAVRRRKRVVLTAASGFRV